MMGDDGMDLNEIRDIMQQRRKSEWEMELRIRMYRVAERHDIISRISAKEDISSKAENREIMESIYTDLTIKQTYIMKTTT